jgi:hypothetical protein
MSRPLSILHDDRGLLLQHGERAPAYIVLSQHGCRWKSRRGGGIVVAGLQMGKAVPAALTLHR